MPLRRAGDVQRPSYGEVLAPVVRGAQSRRVVVAARRLVPYDRVVVEAVPERLHDLHELVRAAVARLVFEVGAVAEVRRLRRDAGCGDVPARPAARYVVEGGELAGDVERMVVDGGRRGRQADVLGHQGQRGQQRERLELLGTAGPGRVGLVAPGRDTVGDEQRVEPAAFEGAGQVGVEGEVELSVGARVRVPPVGDVAAGAVHEGSEGESAYGVCGHVSLPVMRAAGVWRPAGGVCTGVGGRPARSRPGPVRRHGRPSSPARRYTDGVRRRCRARRAAA